MKTSFLTISLAAAILSGCTYSQDKHLTELFTVQQGNFNRLRDEWIVEESLNNPSDQFSLHLEPADPLSTSKGTFPVALLKGDQIPLNERLIFAVIDPVTEKIDPHFEFEVEGNGKLRIYDRYTIKSESEIPLVASEGVLVGKPILYAVVAKDQRTIATAEFIPYPLEITSEQGIRVSLVVTHPMLTRFQLRAEGFKPDEKVKVTHRSGDSEETFELFASETGTFSMGLNPTILGRLGGDAQLLILRSEEELCLDYPWGTKLEKKTFEERSIFPVLFVVNKSPEEMDAQYVQNSLLTHSLLK